MVAVLMIPHFDIPFRIVGPRAVVVEQDSLKEVSNCVWAILGTQIGTRLEVPSFGIEDPTFQSQPIRTDLLVQAVLENEPRAVILMDQNPSILDSMIAEVLARVSTMEDGGV
jgi:hypothetical protein